jgi:ribosomal subunit interface protein
MLQKLEITGVHTEVDESLHKYIVRKIGRLDRYLPRHYRESAHASVRLKEHKSHGRHEATCEVTLHVPGDSIVVNERTVNVYAAVDIAHTKLKQQIIKYRERHADGKHQRRLFVRFRRRNTHLEPQSQDVV